MQQEIGGRRPCRYVVIGGGIAGVTATEELLRLEPENSSITIVTASPVLKQVSSVLQVTRTIEDLEVVERDPADYVKGRQEVRIVRSQVRRFDSQARRVECADGTCIDFDRCLLCTGAVPKLVLHHPNVVGVRDTESIDDLTKRLGAARRVVVLGNGGIALELVHAVRTCEIVWAIRDSYVGNTFFDASASAFIIPELERVRDVQVVRCGERRPHTTDEREDSASLYLDSASASSDGSLRKRRRPTHHEQCATADTSSSYGGALGPGWKEALGSGGSVPDGQQDKRGKPLTIVVEAELETLTKEDATVSNGGADTTAGGEDESWPLYVKLTNGLTWPCDFVVSATGVVPAVGFLGPEFERGEDGGVVVNEHMQTTASPDVYAAGDCCSMTWPESDVWFRMRLWTQARTMALFAARCMAQKVDELGSGFAFELFAHMTHFFGFKVVLLGCFNAQHLPDEEQRRIVQEVVVQSDGGINVDVGQPVSVTRRAKAAEQKAPIEILTRITPGVEYIKVIVVDGKVKGAMLIGDTDLEETFENLILNQLDVSRYGESLLDPDFDLEDYFD